MTAWRVEEPWRRWLLGASLGLVDVAGGFAAGLVGVGACGGSAFGIGPRPTPSVLVAAFLLCALPGMLAAAWAARFAATLATDPSPALALLARSGGILRHHLPVALIAVLAAGGTALSPLPGAGGLPGVLACLVVVSAGAGAALLGPRGVVDAEAAREEPGAAPARLGGDA